MYIAHQKALAMAEKRDITLLAQPIIDLSTNQVNAWEFLTRGPKETALENPLQLFSLARQTNLIYSLKLIVLEKAFQMIRSVGCDENVFLNFTPITLGNKHFIPALEKF